MKRKFRETDYGYIKYMEYGYIDVLPYEAMQKLSKEQVFQHINPYHVKNNIKKARYRTGKYLYQLMWKIIIDEILDGNTVNLPYGGYVYIGVIDERSSKHANLHTYGKVYGMKMVLNQSHSYKFKMRKSRRIELMKKLKEGKHYLK